jgi:acyl carrier protein phosphodiesterase
MNYLAHAFLSFNNEPIIVGNFIADHIKLADTQHLPELIRKGVIIHRKIDAFTDSHPLFIKSKRHFYNGFERYSGVLTDIYYDYLLAKNFEQFTDANLKDFTGNIYKILDNHEEFLPDTSKGFLKYVKQNNTFFEYSKLEGIELVLTHLSFRINHGVQLNESINLFKENEDKIEKDFLEFMMDLVKEVKKDLP